MTRSVLFVCVHNAGRSQMAAAFLTHLGGDLVEVRSAGSAPADSLNPVVVEAMAEAGIDLTAETPKVLTTDAVAASDVVITMGCGDACPVFPGKTYRDWELEDPAGKTLAEVRVIRDEIRNRVRAFVRELSHGGGRPKLLEECRDVQDLLDQVRLRPSMWVRKGSLQELQTFLAGYATALDVHRVDEQFVMEPVGPFAQWVRGRTGWSMSLGWAAAIEKHAGAEEPLDVFFRFLDEYRLSTAEDR